MHKGIMFSAVRTLGNLRKAFSGSESDLHSVGPVEGGVGSELAV
jgi:hypothetical protein